MSEYANDVDYATDPKGWGIREGMLNAYLEVELAAKHGLLDHPKRAKLFNLAWEHGHASGRDDIRYWYDELAVLLT